MKNSKTILHESLGKKVLEPSIGLPYDVPQGYFNHITKALLEKLPKDEAQYNRTTLPSYSLPEGYFEGLSDNILAKVKAINFTDELDSVLPLIKTISRQLPYEVPVGYFDNLTINTTLSEQPQVAKVVYITSKKFWLRMAVAASIFGVIVLAATTFYHKETGNTYASYKNVDLNKSVIKLSDDDLIKYLDNDYIASNTETIILDDGNAPSLEQDAQVVPDNDMTQYLREVSTHKRRKKGI